MTRQVIETGNSFVLVPDAPGTPSTPTVVRRTSSSLTLRTTVGVGGAATSYRWRYSRDSTFSDSDPTVTSTGPEVTISGLSPGASYWIDVQARNSTGSSNYSSNLHTTTSTATPTPTGRFDRTWCYETSDVSSPPSGGQNTLNHTPSGCSRSELSPDATRWVYRYTRTEYFLRGTFTSATAWGSGVRIHSPTSSRGTRAPGTRAPGDGTYRLTVGVEIASALRADPNSPAYLSYIEIDGANEKLNIYIGSTSTDRSAGTDLSSQWETAGRLGIRHTTPSGVSTEWFDAPFDTDNAAPYTNLKAALIALATSDQSEPRTIILEDNAVTPAFSDDTGDDQNWTRNTDIAPLIIPRASAGTPSPVYTSSGVPAGINVILPTSIQIGAITGTPTSVGSGTITITATNSDGSTTWTLDYNIISDLKAPVFSDTAGDDQTWTVGTAILNVVVPTASGLPAPTYAVVGSLPGGLTFNASTRIISGTPTSSGSGTVTIRATNSEGSADWTVDYLITPPRRAFPTQTFTLPVSGYSLQFGFLKEWHVTSNNAVDFDLAPPREDRWLQYLRILSTGTVQLLLADIAEGQSISHEDDDLSDQFESDGQIVVQYGSNVLILSMSDTSDSTEPYVWTGSSEAAAFFRAIPAAGADITLTIRGFTPVVPDLFASASTGVPIARAALVAAVLSASAITGIPTAQASLAPPTISIKASAGAPSASVDIISQLPFNLSWTSERGRTVYVSAVITAGVPRGNGTVYEDQPGRTPLGSVSAGSDLESQTGQSVTAIALNELFTGNITFWDAPSPLAWSTFFTDNPDVSLWMQFAPRGPIYPFVARGHGGTYSAWATGDLAAQAAVTAARAEGARFAFVLRGAPAVTTLSASSTAGVPTGAANLQQPTLSTVISAGVPTARVNLRGQLLSATASAGAPTATINIEEQGVGINAYVPPPGYRPIVLAFLEANVSGADITAEPAVTVGTGNDLDVADDLTITQVERHSNGAQIRLRRLTTGRTTPFSDYFDNEGSPLYPDARLQIQLSDRSIIDGSIGPTGGGFNNWSVANSAQRSKLNAIATGERFVLAILKKITIEASASTIAPAARVALATPLVAVDASAGVPTARIYFDSLPISASPTAGTPTARADLAPAILSIFSLAGVPTARAALVLPTISIKASAGAPTAKASLVPPTLSASASAGTPTSRARLASLVLTTADIDITNLDVYALALINTGTPTGATGTIYNASTNLGSIDAGGDLTARPGQDITRIGLNPQGSGTLRFWDTPAQASWINFFSAYPRATLRLQFEITGPAYELTRGSQGGNFSNWSTSNTAARAAIASARADGKKFIFLLAEERIAVRAGEGERASVAAAGAEGVGRKIDAATRSGSGEFGESATEGVEGTGNSRTTTNLGEGEVGRVTASAIEGQGANVVIKKAGSGEFGKIITSGKEGIGRKIDLLPSTGSGEFGRISTAGTEGTGAKIDLLPVIGSGEFGGVIITSGKEGAGTKIILLPTTGSGEFASIIASGKEGIGRKKAAKTLSGTGEFGTVSSGGNEGAGRFGGSLAGFVKIGEVRGISFPRTGLEGNVSYDITLRSRDRTGNTGDLVPAGTVLTDDLLDVFGAEFVFQRNNTGVVPDPPLSTELERKTDNYIPTGWSDNPQGVSVSNRYEYISSRTGSPGRWSEFGTPGLYDIFLVEGETEAQFIFRRTTSASAPNTPRSSPSQQASDSYIPAQWVRSAQGTTETLPYEWASYRLGGSGNWSVFYPPTLREAHPTARGPIPFFRAISGSSWSNSEANLATTGTNVTGDRVTLYNTSAKYTKTRVWNGSAWITIGKWIDGNLIVEGTILSIFDIIAGAAVKSSNYRAGIDGWRIAQDGDAEFNGAVFAESIKALDIQNAVVLWTTTKSGGVRVRGTAASPTTYPTNQNVRDFTSILCSVRRFDAGVSGRVYGSMIIPASRLSTTGYLYCGVGVANGDKDTAKIGVARLANGNIVMFPEDTREEVNILDMVGFVNPSTAVITPPTPLATSAPNTPSTPVVDTREQTSLTLSTTPGSGGAATLYRWRYSLNRTVSNADPIVTSLGPSITIPGLAIDTELLD